MLCQQCQKRNVSVHFTQIINSSKTELYLCEQCANQKGYEGLGSPISLNDFFSGCIGSGGSTPYVTSPPRQLTCKKCGMRIDEFIKTAKLGCNDCYEAFDERLEPLLKRLHGSFEHRGKAPAQISESIKSSREIKKLKTLLNKAVQNEEYEKAAEIRDRIRSLEV